MAENSSRLQGTERAAILLMSLGEKAASEVLKYMGPKEVQSVTAAMKKLAHISRSQVTDVLNDFVGSVQEESGLGLSADQYIRNVLTRALGEEKANYVTERILHSEDKNSLETLKWMEPRAVAEVIGMEHPQVIAIILTYLEPDQAAKILTLMPERNRVDVLMRIATLDGIQPSALEELNRVVETQLSNKKNLKSANVGGMKVAADILNYMNSASEAEIMDNIKEVDVELGQGIQDLMYTFENLNDVDNRGIQSILREISSQSLVLALKGSSESLKDKIFSNMSRRAAEMLRDELESKGPVRVSEVESAQKEILAVARRLADSGDISLGGVGGEEFL